MFIVTKISHVIYHYCGFSICRRSCVHMVDVCCRCKGSENPCAQCCLKCCICCLWCLEKCMKYLNQNAYTIIGTCDFYFCYYCVYNTLVLFFAQVIKRLTRIVWEQAMSHKMHFSCRVMKWWSVASQSEALQQVVVVMLWCCYWGLNDPFCCILRSRQTSCAQQTDTQTDHTTTVGIAHIQHCVWWCCLKTNVHCVSIKTPTFFIWL